MKRRSHLKDSVQQQAYEILGDFLMVTPADWQREMCRTRSHTHFDHFQMAHTMQTKTFDLKEHLKSANFIA